MKKERERLEAFMKETIRWCISCILPCGALDVVRIVHANGSVEAIGGTVSASEIMQAYPNHVIRKPPSAVSDDGVVPKAVILPPHAKLQKGKIYCLVPVSSAPEKARPGNTTRRKKKKRDGESNGVLTDKMRILVNKRHLLEILSTKVSMQKDRRRGRAGVWRPHLESISES